MVRLTLAELSLLGVVSEFDLPLVLSEQSLQAVWLKCNTAGWRGRRTWSRIEEYLTYPTLSYPKLAHLVLDVTGCTEITRRHLWALHFFPRLQEHCDVIDARWSGNRAAWVVAVLRGVAWYHDVVCARPIDPPPRRRGRYF